MKTLQRLLVAALLLFPLGGFAQTAQSRASLYSEIDAQLPTNGAGQITAVILRAVIKDVVASSANPVTDGAYQPLSPLLTAWAAAPSNGLYYRASSTTLSPVTIGSGLTFTSGTLAASGGGGGGMTNPMTAAGDMIIGGSGGTPVAVPVGTNGKVWTVASGTPGWATPIVTEKTGAVFDNSGSALTAGLKAFAPVPYACTITGWLLTGDVSGSVVVDVRRQVGGSGAFTSLTASATPSLTSQSSNSSNTLTGWTVSLAAGDVLQFIITGTPATVTNATLVVKTSR